MNEQTQTSSTAPGQQYYYYPVGIASVDNVVVTLGSVQYPLTPIYDQYTWNQLNAIIIQPTAIPQFVFPRKDDFGIWPIPQDTYTLTMNAFMRDRNLLIEDYTAGSVSVEAGSTSLIGTSTTFTPAMVGRWLLVTDPTVPGQGYDYRIRTWVSSTELVLDTYWAGSTAANVTYRIGESPEMPLEAHIILPAGTAADFYAGLRSDTTNATWWNNIYWTGDGNNPARDLDSKNVSGGLIGLHKRYENRDRRNLVKRQPSLMNPAYQVWGVRLS